MSLYGDQHNLDLVNADTNSKIVSLLHDPKNFDWTRFLIWLGAAKNDVLSKFVTPNKPSKAPLTSVLSEFDGNAASRQYVAALYKARWVQTKDLISTNLEKFVKFWQANEYGTKPIEGFHLTHEDLQWAVDELCSTVISNVHRWTLDRGPSIINNFFKIILNISGGMELDPTRTYKHELGALFLQSGFFIKDVRKFFSSFVPSNYIMMARALGIPEDDVQKLENGYLIKVTAKSIEKMNSDQRLFVEIEDKFNDNPKNKNRYVIHDMSLTPTQGFMKSWKVCLGTNFLRPESFDTQIRRLIPLVGTEDKLWELAKSPEVINQISEYVRELGTPGLGLVLGAIVNYVLGESSEKRKEYYSFLSYFSDIYANKFPMMVSPKATFYMMVISVSHGESWNYFLKILPKLQYLPKMPDMIDSERINFDFTKNGNLEKFLKVVDDVLLPNKDKLVWNDPRVLVMILKGLGYEKFMEFKFSDEKLQEVYVLLAKISPKSPFIKMLASKNNKIRNEVFSTIQKRMALGGLDPAKFCDANRNLADLPGDEVPENIKTLFAKSFDNLKIAQWRQDVIGSKQLYEKAPWMKDIFVQKVEKRAKEALEAKAHSIPSFVTMTNALSPGVLDKIVEALPEPDVKAALTAHNLMAVTQLVMIIENLNEQHYRGLSYNNMVKLLDALEQAMREKKEKTGAEGIHHEAIRLGVCDIIGKWVEEREEDANRLFTHVKNDPELKKFVLEYFGNYSAINALVKLVNSSEIKPHGTMAPDKLRAILNINNLKLPTEKPVDISALDKISTLKEILNTKNQAKLVWKELQVKKVKNTEEDAMVKSVLLDKYNKSKHGDIALKIIDEWDVAIESQVKGTESWDKDHPKAEIIDPAFHGTGTVAASFILRFGFAIVKSSTAGINTSGKMLGDGIYFSTVLDKAAQYVGDAGFSRGIGNRGFIFQMRANLGKEGKDYRAAGLDSTDGIRSPEWCVYTPNSQLRIMKAYRVELITKNDMRDLKGRYLLGTKKFKQVDNNPDADLV